MPLLFTSRQFAGSDVIILFSVAGPNYRASIILGMYSVWGEVCGMGCVGSVCVVGGGIRGFVAFGSPRALLVVSLLATSVGRASRAVISLGALSSGAWCLVVSLI